MMLISVGTMSKLGSLSEGKMGKAKLPPMGRRQPANEPVQESRAAARESILDSSFSGRMVRPNLIAAGGQER